MWEVVALVLVADLSVEELPWRARPPVAIAGESQLRMDKLPIRCFWRPAGWPVWNHYIGRTLMLWTAQHGANEPALSLLADRRLDDVLYVAPADQERLVAQVRVERDAAAKHLDHVVGRFHNGQWRRDHKLYGIYPENHLWWAARALRELDAALSDETTGPD